MLTASAPPLRNQNTDTSLDTAKIRSTTTKRVAHSLRAFNVDEEEEPKDTQRPQVDKEKIEKELMVRSCFILCRIVVFFFMQFFTLCIILTLSVVNSGVLTIVYAIFALYYIY